MSKAKKRFLETGMVFRDGRLVPIDDKDKKDPMLVCGCCHHTVRKSESVAHVKDCWGMDYGAPEAIPGHPPSDALAYYKRNHPR